MLGGAKAATSARSVERGATPPREYDPVSWRTSAQLATRRERGLRASAWPWLGIHRLSARGAAVCERAPTVVVSVAGEAAERAVFLSDTGLMAHAAPNSLLIGCGTVTVSFARELHDAAAARGLRFLDAPVSGGPEGAANGTLTIMAGGDSAAFAAASEAFDGMGGLSKLMGGAGAGAAAKLINQLLTACNAHAASEALALARSLGLDSPAQVSAEEMQRVAPTSLPHRQRLSLQSVAL